MTIREKLEEKTREGHLLKIKKLELDIEIQKLLIQYNDETRNSHDECEADQA